MRLNQARAWARRQQQGLAVLFVDLDRFKLINDNLGHNCGDNVLIATARRLAGSLRPADTLARFGGDEFLVLLADISEPATARLTAQRLTEVLSEPIDVGMGTVVITASVGVTVSALGTESAEELVCQADRAMYLAKEAGRARAAVFDERSTLQLLDRLTLEAGPGRRPG